MPPLRSVPGHATDPLTFLFSSGNAKLPQTLTTNPSFSGIKTKSPDLSSLTTNSTNKNTPNNVCTMHRGSIFYPISKTQNKLSRRSKHRNNFFLFRFINTTLHSPSIHNTSTNTNTRDCTRRMHRECTFQSIYYEIN